MAISRVALTGGSYQALSLIASCQRQVNLYGEPMPPEQGEPSPATYYPTPGLRLLGTAPSGAGWRCLYVASDGLLYGVYGSGVYLVGIDWSFQLLGAILTNSGIVYMADNGLTIVIVDGSPSGFAITIGSHAFAPIQDPAFYGADRVDYADTFFIFNRPGTAQFYLSPSEWVPGIAFDPLDIAGKVGSSDLLATLIVLRREIWLVGAQKSTEIWFNSGAPDFTYQITPGVFIEHGIAAKYSLAKYDVAVFWVSLNSAGQGIVVRGANYQAERISTHAIEQTLAGYSTISDAIGYVYQQNGHVFYVLTFPGADATWVWDEASKQWHQWACVDGDGVEHRHRSIVAAYAYGTNVVGDHANGNLYALDQGVFTDNGSPIVRRRGFPHMMNDGNRQIYTSFIADMEVGTIPATLVADAPQVYLRWSDDRGKTWGNPVPQSMGATGEYLTSIQWNRLGMARDRVFELFWSIPTKTALNGAFVEYLPAAT